MIWSRPRRFPAVLCGILWAVLLSSAESKVDESVIRTAHSSYVNKGETLRQYSDGRDVVVVIFNENSDILECHVTKSDVNGTRNLFNQAVQNPLSEVQYLFQDDVAKMGRRCRKLMRDIRRSPEGELTALQKRTRVRLGLDQPVKGSDFCSRQFVEPVTKEETVIHTAEEQSHKGTVPPIENETPEQKSEFCCKSWQACSEKIDGLSISKGLYNPYPWPIRSCKCESEFHTCLQDLTSRSEAADAFLSAYFLELQPRCFVPIRRKLCVEYDFWHTECIKKEETEQYALQTSED